MLRCEMVIKKIEELELSIKSSSSIENLKDPSLDINPQNCWNKCASSFFKKKKIVMRLSNFERE